MRYAIASEWIKLRSARSNLVLMTIAVAVPLLLSGLIAGLADLGPMDVSGAVLFPSQLCVLLAGVVGVLGIGQEYRHNTIRVTFAAEPRRWRVLGAKIVVTALTGLAMGLASVVANFAAVRVIMALRDLPATVGGGDVAAMVGGVVLCGLFALAGFAVTAVIRQPAGAIPVILVWPVVVEPLVGVLVGLSVDGFSDWLPFANGFRLAVPPTDLGGGGLGRVGGGLYFAAVVAALTVMGCLLANRRDA